MVLSIATYVFDNMDCFTIDTLNPSSLFSKQSTDDFNKVAGDDMLAEITPGNIHDALAIG